MIRAAAKLLKVMNSESDPGQISLAFCLAMVAGLTPALSLHNLLVLFLVMVLRVNFSAFVLGLGLFSGVAYLLDPIFHGLGLSVLTAPSLNGLWTSLYNSTPWRLERFYNTIVMGSLVASVVLFVPLYIAVNMAVARYREHLLGWVRKTRLMQVIKGTKFYKAYKSISEIRGEL